MARELRYPLSAADFAQLPLPVLTKPLVAPWWNLRWAHHADLKAPFFTSATGRLTPNSGTVPCLYLAKTREAAFFELYGDDLDAAQKRSQCHRFLRGELVRRIFLRMSADFTVKLYDLTAKKSARAIGLDLATLYSPTVNYSREFAQRLHDHPAKFDGIQYLSRHTQSICTVLWGTHHLALASLSFERGPSLWQLAEYDRALPPVRLRLFSTEVEVAQGLTKISSSRAEQRE